MRPNFAFEKWSNYRKVKENMTLSWIDTHNHFWVCDEENSLQKRLEEAVRVGLVQMLICAGCVSHFDRVRDLAHRFHCGYALGLHPLYIQNDWQHDLLILEKKIQESLRDPFFIAIGECGLDASSEAITPLEIQEKVFSSQLKLAFRNSLSVSMHGRGALDHVSKWLRRISVKGVLHAFNGSESQAQTFLNLGVKLGYGGAMTYEGSKRIRKILSELPKEAWVLETDAPDMPSDKARQNNPLNPKSLPSDIAYYGQVASMLRKESIEAVSTQSITNSLEAFPRFQNIFHEIKIAKNT